MTWDVVMSHFQHERNEDGSPKLNLKPAPSPVAAGGLASFTRTCHINGITDAATIRTLYESRGVA